MEEGGSSFSSSSLRTLGPGLVGSRTPHETGGTWTSPHITMERGTRERWQRIIQANNRTVALCLMEERGGDEETTGRRKKAKTAIGWLHHLADSQPIL